MFENSRGKLFMHYFFRYGQKRDRYFYPQRYNTRFVLDIYFYHLILLVAKAFYATDRNVAN
jgi:hypothetical protein